ncbi:hypothetical protein EYE40_12290 [Glaciihabitans arcticus]|uniref:Uncharacterized protein n=1 Tax=Glaciihabitans arcticus TaxID=2668039 RepID=A0A4Q9GWY7_9MICO|nr:hypothetical protein [Glaciihabitans arcticus]TBN58108.1 hypothetical protein EYE40_12290 [Glaciihabitans arcticus]
MRRDLIPWLVGLGLLVLGFGGAVLTLNTQLYSASGFVRGYLEALENRDSAAALDVPGVRTTTQGADALLTDDAMGRLGGISLVRDTAGAGGTRTVVFDYTLGAAKAEGRTEFTVMQTGTRFGLFPTWRFVASPLSTLSVSVLHDDRFEANGLELVSPSGAGAASGLLVFAPGVYELGHESTYLAAKPVSTEVTTLGSIADVAIDVQANATFVEQVQADLATALDDCATQKILMPTGCPFGQPVSNRIDGDPKWSIVDYPEVEIEPGEIAGEWRMPFAPGTAHLRVPVRSLFDGTLSTFDDDVPFTAEYTITFVDGRIVLTEAG